MFYGNCNYSQKTRITWPKNIIPSRCQHRYLEACATLITHMWLTDWLTDWLIDDAQKYFWTRSDKSSVKAVNRSLATLRASLNLSGIFQIASVGAKTLWRCDTCRMCTWLSFDLSQFYFHRIWLFKPQDGITCSHNSLSGFKVMTSRLFRASCGDEFEVLQLCGADVPTHAVTLVRGSN